MHTTWIESVPLPRIVRFTFPLALFSIPLQGIIK